MKNKRNIVAVAGAVLFAASLGLGACGAESDAKGSFDDYRYPYNQTTLKAYPDANMKVDGVLDEDKWNSSELRWLENYDQESEVYFKYTLFFSEKGLYFGAVSKDWHVYYNKPYSQTLNTGFDVYVAKEGDFKLDERVYISFNCGNTHWSHGLNTYEGVVTVQGGDYNTGESEGITLEAFVPWDQFGYTEPPARMRSVCSYRLVSGAGTTSSGSAMWTGYVNGGDYAKYYDFDANGWESVDAEGSLLGDSKSGYAKGPDWDMSDAANGVYRSNKAQQNIKATGQTYPYFKDVWSDSYTVSATFKPNVRDDGTCGINAASPRAGIMTGYNEYCFSALMIHFSKTNLAGKTLELTSSYSKGGSTTHTVIYKSAAGAFDIAEGVTLTCTKVGSSFFYYIGSGDDAQLVYMEEIPLLNGKAEPGIQTTSCDVTVSEPTVLFKEGGSAQMDYLNKTGVFVLETENGAGGSVTSDVYSVKRGDSLTLSVLPTSGFYKLSKFEISYGGGEYADITEQVRANMNGGKYVLENVQSNISVRTVFERFADSEVSKLTGTVVSAENDTIPVSGATVAVEGKTDKTLYYTATTNASGIYSIRVPAGEYNVTVFAGGYEKTVTENVTVGAADSSLNASLRLALVGGSVKVRNKVLASSTTRCTFSPDDSAVVTFAQSGTDAEVAWLARLGAVSGDFTVTALYEYLGGSDVDPSGGFIVSDGSNKFALFALGNDANWGSGFRYYNTSTFANRWQERKSTPQIVFKTGKVIMTLKRVDGVYFLYSDMYTEGKTEATTLRGQVTGGAVMNVTAGTGTVTIPAGQIGVGVSFRNDSSCKITLLSAE